MPQVIVVARDFVGETNRGRLVVLCRRQNEDASAGVDRRTRRQIGGHDAFRESSELLGERERGDEQKSDDCVFHSPPPPAIAAATTPPTCNARSRTAFIDGPITPDAAITDSGGAVMLTL